MSKSLVVLAAQAIAIEVALIENSGEITPELEDILADIDLATKEKIDSYSLVIARMESISKFYQERADNLLKIAKACSTVSERLSNNIKSSMAILGTNEVVGNDIKFKLQKTTPKVMVDNEIGIPGEFQVVETTVKPDKRKIADHLKTGAVVDWAHLEQGYCLREYVNNVQLKGNK